MADSLPNGRAYRTAVLLITLLPVVCLAWRWSRLPAHVSIHFSRGGADVYSDKRVFLLLVLLPLFLYYTLPLAYQKSRYSLLMGMTVLLSFILSGLVLLQ